MPAAFTKGSPLKPLPMRVTKRQFDRLQQARSRDSYSVQEHVRRALDVYLDMIEQAWPNVPAPALPAGPASPLPTATTPKGGDKPAANRVPSVKRTPKVTYR